MSSLSMQEAVITTFMGGSFAPGQGRTTANAIILTRFALGTTDQANKDCTAVIDVVVIKFAGC